MKWFPLLFRSFSEPSVRITLWSLNLNFNELNSKQLWVDQTFPNSLIVNSQIAQYLESGNTLPLKYPVNPPQATSPNHVWWKFALMINPVFHEGKKNFCKYLNSKFYFAYREKLIELTDGEEKMGKMFFR